MGDSSVPRIVRETRASHRRKFMSTTKPPQEEGHDLRDHNDLDGPLEGEGYLPFEVHDIDGLAPKTEFILFVLLFYQTEGFYYVATELRKASEHCNCNCCNAFHE